MSLTDNPAEVGQHLFERAGLGLAPFRFIGASENRFTTPDGHSKPGGSCDYCGTAILTECHVKSADGKEFKVGCNCIEKVGDTGLLKAYRTSKEYRQHQAELRRAKSANVRDQVKAIATDYADKLAALPHPRGFTDWKTHRPLSALDQVKWDLQNCGAAGLASTLKWLRRILNQDDHEQHTFSSNERAAQDGD